MVEEIGMLGAEHGTRTDRPVATMSLDECDAELRHGNAEVTDAILQGEEPADHDDIGARINGLGKIQRKLSVSPSTNRLK